jgi:hypothetical protein
MLLLQLLSVMHQLKPEELAAVDGVDGSWCYKNSKLQYMVNKNDLGRDAFIEVKTMIFM